jgi:hypothetical protein
MKNVSAPVMMLSTLNGKRKDSFYRCGSIIPFFDRLSSH